MRGRAPRRGLSIALVLMVLSLISVIAFGLTALSIQSLNVANADVTFRSAGYVAEAGIADACSQLKITPTWHAGFANKTMTSIQGSYTVTVLNNYTGSSTVTASDGTLVPKSCAYVVSTGLVGTPGAPRGSVTVHVLLELAIAGGFNPYVYAAFGLDSVSLKGNASVDSYDSTQGAYGSAGNTGVGHDQGADVGTNATSGTPVSYNSHATNYGYTYYGSGITQAEADAMWENGSANSPNLGAKVLSESVSGVPLASPLAAGSNPGPTSGVCAPGAYTSLNVTGTVTLQEGDYYFPNGITVSGTLRAPATGSARIYFGGTLNFKGGTIGSTDGSSNPGAIQMLGTKDATAVTATGGGSSKATFVVFAPTADIDIQSSVCGYYGSVIGKTVKIQSSGVGAHYDRNLARGDATLPSQAAIKRILWRRN